MSPKQKLVSVIIPCFNAQRWVREAIESCLRQSYGNVEVIVVDDGSSDRSVEIIQEYEGQIIWESGPNRGGNYARNRGFQLAKGEYIQYLDSDDYLLPEKLTQQVQALEATGADVVYSDVIYKHHDPDGKIHWEAANLLGTVAPYVDVLESLLTYGSLSPSPFLLRRKAVVASGGWDETLKAGQDTDFFLSVALSGAKFLHQPGVHSIYRRYGNVTVSTSSKARRVRSFCIVLEKAKHQLQKSSYFSEQYRWAIARAYSNMLVQQWQELSPGLVLQLIWRILMLAKDGATGWMIQACAQFQSLFLSGKSWVGNSSVRI